MGRLIVLVTLILAALAAHAKGQWYGASYGSAGGYGGMVAAQPSYGSAGGYGMAYGGGSAGGAYTGGGSAGGYGGYAAYQQPVYQQPVAYAQPAYYYQAPMQAAPVVYNNYYGRPGLFGRRMVCGPYGCY